MKMGDRVKIEVGNYSAKVPTRFIGREGIVLGPAPGPNQMIVRLADEELFVCYEDEMEILPTPEEKGEGCQRCGETYELVWSAPSKLWENVTGFGRGGILCPRCFAILVEEHSNTFLYWSCDTRGYPGLQFTRGKVKSIGLGIFLQHLKLRLLHLFRRL